MCGYHPRSRAGACRRTTTARPERARLDPVITPRPGSVPREPRVEIVRGLEVLRDRQRTNPRSVDAALAVIVFAAALWVPLSDPGHGGGRGHEAVLTGHGAVARRADCRPGGGGRRRPDPAPRHPLTAWAVSLLAARGDPGAQRRGAGRGGAPVRRPLHGRPAGTVADDGAGHLRDRRRVRRGAHRVRAGLQRPGAVPARPDRRCRRGRCGRPQPARGRRSRGGTGAAGRKRPGRRRRCDASRTKGCGSPASCTTSSPTTSRSSTCWPAWRGTCSTSAPRRPGRRWASCGTRAGPSCPRCPPSWDCCGPVRTRPPPNRPRVWTNSRPRRGHPAGGPAHHVADGGQPVPRPEFADLAAYRIVQESPVAADGQDPRQPGDGEAACPGPRPVGGSRLPDRPGATGCRTGLTAWSLHAEVSF